MHYHWSSAMIGARTMSIKDPKKGSEVAWQSSVCGEVIQERGNWRDCRTFWDWKPEQKKIADEILNR